jgi:hypothetical protein
MLTYTMTLTGLPSSGISHAESQQSVLARQGDQADHLESLGCRGVHLRGGVRCHITQEPGTIGLG